MTVLERNITETEILNIVKQRENNLKTGESNLLSFEEVYKIGLDYIPKL